MHKKARRPRRKLEIIRRLDVIAEREQLTNAEIAAAIGCDTSAVSKWRAKNKAPRYGVLRALLLAFIEKHEPKRKAAAR